MRTNPSDIEAKYTLGFVSWNSVRGLGNSQKESNNKYMCRVCIIGSRRHSGIFSFSFFLRTKGKTFDIKIIIYHGARRDISILADFCVKTKNIYLRYSSNKILIQNYKFRDMQRRYIRTHHLCLLILTWSHFFDIIWRTIPQTQTYEMFVSLCQDSL